MKARVNLQLLKTAAIDSGALGVLSMVVHQFSSPGRYSIAISNQGKVLKYIQFDVDAKSEVMQLDIDLAQAATLKKKAHTSATPSSKIEDQTEQIISPKGYVLFHVSSGSGYSVMVSDSLGRAVFNSMKLDNNDLFAVSLLEPGSYSMRNSIDSAAGEITVSLPPEMSGKLKDLDTQYVDVSVKKLDPQRIELISTQGLVFRTKSSARIVITKKSTPQAEAARIRQKPMISWRKLEPERK
ncbi:hypothetical protein [Methanothrix sp.]|uniref:hypothetical protein n=1 Tax=Methanothrix sp. TaxID=90426 RepID=UPI003C785460